MTAEAVQPEAALFPLHTWSRESWRARVAAQQPVWPDPAALESALEELRLAQAQLVGWLEGLFHGIQATLFTQQAMAQSQLEEVRRRRALEMAQPGAAPPAPPSGYL